MKESSVNVKIMYAGFGLILIMMLGLMWLAHGSINRIEVASRWVQHDDEVIINVRTMAKSLSDMEMGARGKLLTGDDAVYAVWENSKKSFSTVKGEIETQLKDDAKQLAATKLLSKQMKAWMDQYNPILQARGTGPDGSRALAMLVANQEVRERRRLDLQRTLAGIEQKQKEKREEHRRDLLNAQQDTQRALVTNGLFAIFLGTLLALYLTNSSRRLLKANQGLMKEVAERQRAQREIHDLHSQNEQILSSTTEGIVGINQRGRVTFANAAAAEMLGTELEQMISKPLDNVLRQEARSSQFGGLNQYVTASLRDGKTSQVTDEMFLRRDSSSFPVEYTVTPLQEERVDEANHEVTTTGALIVFRDITERKRAQQMVLRLASIVESSKDAILSHTLDGKIVSWNQAALELYDFLGRDLENKSLSLLFPATATDEIDALLEKIQKGERVEPYQTTLVQRDGTLINVALTLYPVRDTNGTVMGASSNARLVLRKRAEDDLPTYPAAFSNAVN